MKPIVSKTLIPYAKCSLIALSIAILCSCGSLTPTVREPQSPSYDGNSATSGIIGFMPDGSLEISKNGRDRFNGLVDKFGGRFMPPLARDYGIEATDHGTFSMTLEAGDKWLRMSEMMQNERIGTR